MWVSRSRRKDHKIRTPSLRTPVVVKVENLSKTTEEEDLIERLEDFQLISHKVVKCESVPVNYAYLNCPDIATAEEVVDFIHQSMLLHSNLLTAKVKQERGSRHSSFPATQTLEQTSKLNTVKVQVKDSTITGEDLDEYFKSYGELSFPTIMREGCPNYAYVNFTTFSSALEARSNSTHNIDGVCVQVVTPRNTIAVKVLIYCIRITGIDLDDYFSSYGELTSQTIIRQGSPCFAYINFKNPLSAEIVRAKSPHTINGVLVPAICSKEKKKSLPSHVVEKSVRIDFPCDPLAVTMVMNQLALCFRHQKMVKIEPKNDKFIVHVKESSKYAMKEKIESTIANYESAIACVELELYFYCLPVLADLTTQIRIFNIRGPLTLKIIRGREQVPLGTLGEHYMKWKSRSSDNMLLQMYLSTPTTKESRQPKHCYDDRTSQPHREDISKDIDRECDKKRSMKGVSNQRTRKKRERTPKFRPMITSESDIITLQLRAHEDYIQELISEIMDIINGSIQQVKIPLLPSAAPTSSFANHLLDSAKKKFVSVTFDEDGVILEGKTDLVTDTEAELREIIVQERDKKVQSKC